MSIYVNFDHMIDYLRKVRQSRNINNSPYMIMLCSICSNF